MNLQTDSSGPELSLQFAMNLPPQRNICQLLPKLIYTPQSSGGSVNLQCFVYLSNNNTGNCVSKLHIFVVVDFLLSV